MAKFNRFVALDTETGGLPTREKKEATTEVALTEVALVVVDNNSLSIIDKWSDLIAPYGDELIYTEGAAKVSGITKKMCEKEGEDIEAVYNNVRQILVDNKVGSKKPIIIMQNKSFDLPFMQNLFKMFKDNFEKYYDRIEDTMEWSRLKWPDESKHGLGVIAERCGLDHVEAHRALPDTIITAEIFIHFIKSLRGAIGAESKSQRFRETFKF